MKFATLALLVTLMLAYGAMAALKSCTDTECKVCTTVNIAPDQCQSGGGSSFKYVCATNVTYMTYGNTDCSGTPSATLDFGKPGTCHTFGGSSMMATCGNSGGPGSCLLDTPAGAVDLSVIPTAVLYINRVLASGAIKPLLWVFNLCNPTMRTPTYNYLQPAQAGYVLQYELSGSSTVWPQNLTAGWTWRPSLRMAHARFGMGTNLPLSSFQFDVYVSCGPTVDLQVVSSVNVSLNDNFAVQLSSSVFCAVEQVQDSMEQSKEQPTMLQWLRGLFS